jgi:thiosulfate dehydrogenase [quinone] large subunit
MAPSEGRLAVPDALSGGVQCSQASPAASTGRTEWKERQISMITKRNIAAILGGIAAVALFYLVNPWSSPEANGTINQIVTVAFWVSFLALLVVLFEMRKEPGDKQVEVEGPAFTRFLFGSTRAGLFWLPIRLFVGFAWLEAGWHKASGAGWLDGGSALQGYWTHAVAIPATGAGSPAITYDWYRTFLQALLDNNAYTWFAPLIAFGEMAVGIGLIIGCLTGFAAFFGALMSMSFLLAGSDSSNPVMLSLAIGLILGWKVSGYYGLDRYILPMLGTPWRPGHIAGRNTHPAGAGAG